MVPSGPTTGPGVTAPSRCRCQRSTPAVGPADTEAPLCLASCSAEGHGAQLARLGASAGVAWPGADELAAGGTRGDPAAPHATTRALIATASRVPDQPAEAGPDLCEP
jgi:hypothetical protein